MNLVLQKARLTRLVSGRPLVLEFNKEYNGIVLQILNDALTKNVSFSFSEDDAKLSDDDLVERILKPALNNLDGATYPERFERFMEAIKIEMKEFKNDQT